MTDMTFKQENFITTLLTERNMNPLDLADTETMTSKEASALIKELLAIPRPAKKISTDPEIKVPAGRYAVEVNGKLKFYRVDCPIKGKWDGYTFVKMFSSDETYPVRGEAKGNVLKMIAENPAEASLNYGKHIGHCGVCGKQLTDEDSRAKGIGPVCAENMGW